MAVCLDIRENRVYSNPSSELSLGYPDLCVRFYQVFDLEDVAFCTEGKEVFIGV